VKLRNSRASEVDYNRGTFNDGVITILPPKLAVK